MSKILNIHTGGVIGDIKSYGGGTVPAYALACQGQAVSRTTFAALFAAIGISYGAGDGVTTFNVPNGQGAFLRGSGSQVIGGKTYSATLGASVGDATAVNGLHDTGHAHPPASPATNFYGSQAGTNTGQHTTVTSNQDTFVGATGPAVAALAGDAETRPANIGVNYIIIWK